jgi:hypothetical protein
MGANNFYTLIFTGSDLDYLERLNSAPIIAGLGFGHRSNFGPFIFDSDISAKHSLLGLTAGEKYSNFFEFSESTYASLRTSIGIKLFSFITIFGGLSHDIYFPKHQSINEYEKGSSNNYTFGDLEIKSYPRWFLGVRI